MILQGADYWRREMRLTDGDPRHTLLTLIHPTQVTSWLLCVKVINNQRDGNQLILTCISFLSIRLSSHALSAFT